MLKIPDKIPTRIFYLVFIIALAFIHLSCQSNNSDNECGEYSNPYGLDIIYCQKDYKDQIAKDPKQKLLDMEKIITNISLDIRYATNNNFTGQIIYTKPKAFLRKEVAEALKKVNDSLSTLGLSIKIWDAYRPYAATVKFYQVYPDTNFVANPKYGSRHNRGCAVDLTLINKTTGKEIPMPTDFDDFTEKAHPEYSNLPPDVIQNRTLLFNIMSHFGFTHYPTEWWHFDYKDWQNYKLMDLSFEELEKEG